MPPSIYLPLILFGSLAQLPTAVYVMTQPQRQRGQPLTRQAKILLALSLLGATAVVAGAALFLRSAQLE